MARQHSGDGTIRDPGVGPDLGAFHVEHHDNEREDIMTEQTEQSDMRDRKLETIQNLIAKAEATTFEHEADAFMAKAQELMTRYQIDAFMLATSTGRASTDVPETRIVKVFGPYAAVRTNLLNIIACANEVRVVQNHADDKAEDQEERKQGNFYRICWLTGFPTDIENVMMLFASLNLQMVQTAGKHKGDKPEYEKWDYRWVSGERWAKDFMLGFARGVSDRLTAARDRAREEARVAGQDFLPVLRDRKAMVNAAYAEAHPRGTVRIQQKRYHGSENYSNGRAAGQRSNVGESALGNHRAALHA
jgi:hypothetical protein